MDYNKCSIEFPKGFVITDQIKKDLKEVSRESKSMRVDGNTIYIDGTEKQWFYDEIEKLIKIKNLKFSHYSEQSEYDTLTVLQSDGSCFYKIESHWQMLREFEGFKDYLNPIKLRELYI